jgi:MYXO-CTERM domain-containing protein
MANVNASAAAWSNSSKPCTYLNITATESAERTPHAINDGHNAVIFRNATKWCHLNANDECEAMPYYEPAALALTSVSASTSSGVIRDADIEVNAFHFSWADLVLHPELRGTQIHDLANALTHEMGHLIGLDHTCYTQGPAPLDQNGNPIPSCSNASAEVLETTMFPSANPGDIDKRSLAPDDLQALCDIYPLAQDPKACSPPSPPGGCGSCALAGAPTPTAGILLMAAVSLLVWRRRRRPGD